MRDDNLMRHLACTATEVARAYVDLIEGQLTYGEHSLPEADQVRGLLEDARTALTRINELLHGDLSDQTQR
jgi:hypothetical protein